MSTMSVDFSMAGKQVLVTGASSGLAVIFPKCSRERARMSSSPRDASIDYSNWWKKSGTRNSKRRPSSSTSPIAPASMLRSTLPAHSMCSSKRRHQPNDATARLHRRIVACASSIRISTAIGKWRQSAARRMVDAKIAGSIINVTSILASRVAGGVAPYAAAKAGLSRADALDGAGIGALRHPREQPRARLHRNGAE